MTKPLYFERRLYSSNHPTSDVYVQYSMYIRYILYSTVHICTTIGPSLQFQVEVEGHLNDLYFQAEVPDLLAN